MNDLIARLSRVSAARAIRGILILQVMIAVFLVTRDVAGSWAGLGFAPEAPALDQPVRPGDQTRRFDPDRAPTLPARPGMAAPPARDMPARLQFDFDGDRLSLHGEIAPNDAARFADWLADTLPPPQDGAGAPAVTVSLDSPGGSVADALAIGRAIRDRGFATEVTEGRICMSACPYLLAAGVTRAASADGFVGVHQHYFGESTVLPAWMAVEDIQRGQAEVVAYLDEMGVDLRLMRHSLATPPDEIYILLPDELTEYALVTPTPAEG